jgi:HEPN domain-containing protein
LFLKGLLLLNNIDIDETHETQKLLEKIKSKYSEKSVIYKGFKNIYFSQEKILKEYRKINNITNAHELYMSLRYPESIAGKQYEYYPLMYNGDEGIKLFKKLCEDITNIKKFMLSEYHSML